MIPEFVADHLFEAILLLIGFIFLFLKPLQEKKPEN